MTGNVPPFQSLTKLLRRKKAEGGMNKVGSIIKNGQEVLADEIINFANDRGSFFVDEKIFEIDDRQSADDVEIILEDGLRVAIRVLSVQYLATIRSYIIKFIAKS